MDCGFYMKKICTQITILLTAPVCNILVFFFGCIDKTELSGEGFGVMEIKRSTNSKVEESVAVVMDARKGRLRTDHHKEKYLCCY